MPSEEVSLSFLYGRVGGLKGFTAWQIREFVSKPQLDERGHPDVDPSWPKISIVTPSYNQGKFLERTILSVLNQGYPNLEYMVIDGGSTDGSLEIIEKYENYIDYWVCEPDGGQADGINKGFRRATGELVGWQNSDDLYLPGSLKRIAVEHKTHPNHDVLFGNIYLIDGNDGITKEMRFIPFNIEHLVYYDWNLSSQAAFWKTDLFGSVGFLDDAYHVGFDWDWFIRLGMRGCSFLFIREFLGAYRIHEASKLVTVTREERLPVKKKILIQNKLNNDGTALSQLRRAKIFIKRVIWYLIQGDFQYLLEGVKRRLRLITTT